MTNKKRGRFEKQKKKALFSGYEYPELRRFSGTEAKPILEEIKKRRKNDKIRIHLANYLIVRSVTMFEVFLLNQAYRKSKRNPRAKKLFSHIQTNGTIAEQVISSFSFMNLDDINNVFSILLNIDDYLEEIKKESIWYADSYSYEDAHIKYTNPLHKNWNVFLKVFELRHDIIHHNKHYVFNYFEIRNFVGMIIQFLMCSISVTK